ncbi:NnrS family protein [Defluviimonas sp. SAOS-178_SWC]|uniref:NnrS family protein n=1 Tax=Defluviimonas sp. SAOS-178_SWC TaxID=3121287 RepID=UPI003221DA08
MWRAPHLPLFLLAAVWAALAPLVWLFPALSDDPAGWHRQELILGFAGAAMGGYLLTALPHWLKLAERSASGRGPGKRAVQALVVAWIAGRVAALQPDTDLSVLTGISIFPLGLSACLLVPVLSARLWSRLPIALAPVGLLAAGLWLRMTGDGLTAALAMALLVAVVGGRIVPAFLRARAGHAAPPVTGRVADLVLALALAAHLLGMRDGVTGWLLLAAAAGQGARMLRWPLAEGLAGRPADLAMLVAAWLWLPAGLALIGLLLVAPSVLAGLSPPAGVHALTMGLMGGMIQAVMARASMRRGPGVLQAGNGHKIAFALIMLATVLRLALSASPEALAVPTLTWCLGWAVFAGCAVRSLWAPVPHPVLSAARPGAASARPARR